MKQNLLLSGNFQNNSFSAIISWLNLNGKLVRNPLRKYKKHVWNRINTGTEIIKDFVFLNL